MFLPDYRERYSSGLCERLAVPNNPCRLCLVRAQFADEREIEHYVEVQPN